MVETNVKERKNYIDNLKGLLMILVLIGHFMVPFTAKSSNMLFLRIYIYTFHMPCFLMISGILFKGKIEEKNIELSIKKYVIPYIIVNFILYLFMVMLKVGSEYKLTSTNFNVFIPLWSFWYLIALSIYSIITPYLIKNKYTIIGSILLSVLLGFFPTVDFLSLTKIACFYPYYLIGNKINTDIIDKYRDKKIYKLISIIFIALSMIIFYKFRNNLYLETYTFTADYTAFLKSQTYVMSAVLRLFQIIFGVLFSFALICITPNIKSFISRIGKNSLYPYIIHNYILAIYYFINRQIPFFNYVNSCSKYIIFFIACIGLSYVLSTDFVVKNTKFIFMPFNKKE